MDDLYEEDWEESIRSIDYNNDKDEQLWLDDRQRTIDMQHILNRASF